MLMLKGEKRSTPEFHQQLKSLSVEALRTAQTDLFPALSFFSKEMFTFVISINNVQLFDIRFTSLSVCGEVPPV